MQHKRTIFGLLSNISIGHIIQKRKKLKNNQKNLTHKESINYITRRRKRFAEIDLDPVLCDDEVLVKC